MKGTFFTKPLELLLDVDGESWKQGETVTGILKVKNHGNENASLQDFGLSLSYGLGKKIKTKDPKAFVLHEKFLFKNDCEVAGGNEIDLPFKFTLKNNAPISEKSAGLYLLCGYKEEPFKGGMLELNILPCETISNLFEVFENLLRFKVKSLKNKNDCIEATMVVPTSKDFYSVQQLKVLVRMIEKDLNIDFNFKLKKISFEDGIASTKDHTLKVNKIFTPKDYLIYGDAFDQEKVFGQLQEIVEGVKVKPII